MHVFMSSFVHTDIMCKIRLSHEFIILNYYYKLYYNIPKCKSAVRFHFAQLLFTIRDFVPTK